VSATIVDNLTPTTLSARSNYVVYRTRVNGVTEIYSAGTYDDKIVVQNEQLLFAEKIVIYDTDRIDTLLVTPL
jgi:3-phenylpropionate/cinnamic acid dioxygenase small subunit